MNKEKKMEITEPITDMESFAAAIRERLAQMNPTCDVAVHEATKNNNLKLTGIAIREKSSNIAPTVYLEDFFKAYQDGKPLDEICRMIEKTLHEANLEGDFDLNKFSDFSAMKEKICYKLVNAERNAALLEEVPHRMWQDLAVVYYVPVSIEPASGFPSILIRNRAMESWGVDENILFDCANRNMPALFPAEIMPLTDVISSMFHETESHDGITDSKEDTLPLYIVTNDRKTNGAAVLLYDGILDDFAEKFGGDFYILPSSIHETLFLPVPQNPDSDEHTLTKMVREINAGGCVASDEILSDNVYLYHKEDGSVTLVS